MAFSVRNLSVLAYANGFTLWHYKATDVVETSEPVFFAPAADMLTIGDVMIVSSPMGSRMLSCGGDGTTYPLT